MNVIDVLGILIFCVSAVIIYQKPWFYSFYPFVKFWVVFFLSFALGLILSTHIPYKLPITTLQVSLIIELISFLILWKVISFKRVFLSVSQRIFNLDRFIVVHHINRYTNVIPSVVVAFFLTFFLFTVAVSQGAGNTTLQSAIEKSKIVKPLAYEIYFAGAGSQNFNFFNGTLFKITPAAYFPLGTSLNSIKSQAILAFRQKLDIERVKAGLSALPAFLSKPIQIPGEEIFSAYPSNPSPSPTQTPISQTPTSQQLNTPTATPVPVYQPTVTQAPYVPIPTQYIPIKTPTQTPISQTPTPQPTNTPTLTPTKPLLNTPTAIPVVVYQPPPQVRPTPQLVNISQIEQDIFTLTNEQRKQNGIPPLILDPNISAIARAHSVDMNTRNYFSHINPDGLDPFQRMRAGGISFTAAGENISGGPSAEIIMTAWMNSPGHRANILNPAFTRIGVGVSVSTTYGLLATQDFAN